MDSSFQLYTDNSSPELDFISEYLLKKISAISGITINLSSVDKGKKQIRFIRETGKFSSEEASLLKVDQDRILISAGSANGIFYGVQSLLQLLAGSINNNIPCCEIQDSPRFEWRGMHLDVCRHFYSINNVKKYIDLLAYHKMNVFHWHLVEDQGWRIEIKKYPLLTEVGAWREKNGERYGGFYTQDEIKDVVEYAAQRFIRVVPEIEMPGHSVAAVAAYPELSCRSEKIKVETNWGVFDDVYCAGRESTFEFLENVIDEVVNLFPGYFIHIGGDECPKTRWKECPLCQKRIQENNLKDEFELQSYFIKRMAKYIESKGKAVIGWDEILEGGLAENAAVMSWQGIRGGIAAARSGNRVVMSPTGHCYFDYAQAESGEPKSFNAFLPLEKVYEFEPLPEDLNSEEQKLILGGQGNVWSEYMPDWNHVEYMVIPRISAMAEVLWSDQSARNYQEFLLRLETLLQLLDKFGFNYRKLDK